VEARRFAFVRFRDVLVGGLVAEQPHRRDAIAHRAADKIDHRHFCGAAGKVEQRHFDGRMGAAVAHQRRFHPAHQRRARPRVFADQHRREMIAHRGDEPAQRVAGHGRRRGGLAPADRAVLRLDPHHHVLRMRDVHARHLHRLLERQRHRNGVDATDHEGRAVLRLWREGMEVGVDGHGRILSCPCPDRKGRMANSEW
jgi:hypothetical protein